VEAHSEGVGKGARFTIVLPLLEEGGQGSHRVQEGEPGNKRRILVVEDNQDAAESLQELLSLAGHEVRIAPSGMVALNITDQWIPEVVVCDIGLPEMDGYALCRRLRERPSLEGCRLIALTGCAHREDVNRAKAAGFDVHLTKPVDPDVLEDMIAHLAA
jgi:CheY-like chemotaxis protein